MPVSPELGLKPKVLVPGRGAFAVSRAGNAASDRNLTHTVSCSVLAPD